MEGLREQHITQNRTLNDFKEPANKTIKYLSDAMKDEDEGERQALITYQLSILSQLECGVITQKDLDPQLGKLTALDKFSKKSTLAQVIAESYHDYQWKEYFGLNVEEVLNLPFPVWLERRDFLLKKREEREKAKAHEQKEKEQEKMENAKVRELLFKTLPFLSALSVGSSKG